MLLHFTATLCQTFFPALQEEGFLNVRHNLDKWRAKMAPTFLDFKNSKNICVPQNTRKSKW